MAATLPTPDELARTAQSAYRTAIDPSGVKYIISPYDEFALEAALKTREAAGQGEVAVLTLGDGAASEQLRAALAMGADRAVLLKGEITLDGLATAKALTAELQGSSAPLILFGVKAADDDQQQVGPADQHFSRPRHFREPTLPDGVVERARRKPGVLDGIRECEYVPD